ncbi:MAG: tetratricopeptide repeat protein [Persicimonas sp.]
MNETHRAGFWASPGYLGAVLIALVSCCALACNKDRADAVRFMNQGIELYEANKTTDAIERLEKARDTDPSFAEPPLQLGQLYHREFDDLEKAEQAYREALQRRPGDPEITYKLGSVLADAEKHTEAVSQFEQTVEEDEEHAKAWYRMGLSHRADGAYPEAVEAFMESIETNPIMKVDEDDPGGAAYHELGDLYNWFGFYDKALQVYENGIENNEGVARLYGGRGIAQLELERYDEAIDSFKRGLEVDEGSGPMTFNLAVAYTEADQSDKAAEILEDYISNAKDPDRRAAAENVLAELEEERDEADE